MNYYKVEFSEVITEENGDSICMIDYAPARKNVSKKNKEEAVDVGKAVAYSICVALGDNNGAIERPSYFKSHLTMDQLNDEMIRIHEKILNNFKETLDKLDSESV
jgi:hypothetical protein